MRKRGGGIWSGVCSVGFVCKEVWVVIRGCVNRVVWGMVTSRVDRLQVSICILHSLMGTSEMSSRRVVGVGTRSYYIVLYTRNYVLLYTRNYVHHYVTEYIYKYIISQKPTKH